MINFEKAATIGVTIITALAAGASVFYASWRESQRYKKNLAKGQGQGNPNPKPNVFFQGDQNPATQAAREGIDAGYGGGMRKYAEPPKDGEGQIINTLRGASGMFSKLFRCIQALITLVDSAGRVFKDDDYACQPQPFYNGYQPSWTHYNQQPNPININNNGGFQQCAFRKIGPTIYESVPVGTPGSFVGMP